MWLPDRSSREPTTSRRRVRADVRADESEPVESEPGDEETDEVSDDADASVDEHDGDEEFPALDEWETAFEEFDRCITEQLPAVADGGWIESGELPDPGEWDKAFEDLFGGSVTVFSPGGEDGDLTLLDFGDGDGTITITQTDGTISVSTDGDVDTVEAGFPDLGDLGDLDLGDLDLGDLDLGDVEFDTEVGTAFESCASLLPTDGIFDMVGEFVGDLGDLGDFGDWGDVGGAEDE